MKKILILPLLFFATVSFGQVLLGPQAGFNIGTLHNTQITIKEKLGWHGGWFIGIPLSKHIYVMPALMYSSRGFKYDYTTTTSNTAPDTSGTNVTTDVTLNANVDATLGYLDIPVLLTIFSGEARGLFIQAGPQFSYLIKNSTNLSTTSTITINGGASSPSAPSTDTEVTFHKGDLALAGGIGYKFPSFLMVYTRLTTGFMKVQESKGFVKDENAGKNFLIEIGAALTFGGR